MSEQVHNHRPYLPICEERVVDGRLEGACMSEHKRLIEDVRKALKVGRRWMSALDTAERMHRELSREEHWAEKVQEAEYDFRDSLPGALAALAQLEVIITPNPNTEER